VEKRVLQEQAERADSAKVLKEVSEYYGETLKASTDLKTNACCTGETMPPYVKESLRKIHPDVIARYYGCGLCFPDDDLTGLSMLDLGCGAGRDCYLLSQLVGESGSVVGVDMTEDQLETELRNRSLEPKTGPRQRRVTQLLESGFQPATPAESHSALALPLQEQA